MDRVEQVSRPSRESGFTLVEMLVSMVLTVQVLAAVYLLFDFNSRLAKVQTNLTELQQAQRVAQYDMARLLRMAGRGNLYPNLALNIRNNVPTLTRVASGTSPGVLPGSDVLQVRGVFSTPLYQIPPDPAFLTLDNAAPNLATRGTLVVSRISPAGVVQDLTPFRTAITSAIREALILVSSADRSIYHVVELDPATSNASSADQVTVGFRITAGTNAAAFGALSSTPGTVLPANFRAIQQVGILEEYRFYVRETFARLGDSTSKLLPKLSRARMFPGTQVPYNGLNANLEVDVADDIWDLQVALGYNTPLAGGEVDSATGLGQITETADGEDDDWLYNSRDDVATDAVWNDANLADPRWNGPGLFVMRLTTLARTTETDRGYTAPLLDHIEDKYYNITPWVGLLGINTDANRKFRRRILQTVLDLRGVGND
jgi:prepilin-type N-terminal cleavage/methylation domain-containing protein